MRGAVDLKDMDFLSKSDAYVEIELNGIKLQTDFVPNNLNPKWGNQRLHFIVNLSKDIRVEEAKNKEDEKTKDPT